MRDFKKILFATDFSDCAAHAQAYAFAFAKRFKAQLHIVHVVDTAYTSYAGVYGFGAEVDMHIEEVKKSAQEGLAAISDLARTQGIDAHPHLLQGRPAEETVEKAKQSGCDLLVTGTHGRSGVDHFLFGSTAERIVRYSGVPVLAVKPIEREFVRDHTTFTLKRVLCPCDLSPLSEQALALAANVCRVFDAELTLLHVIDSRIEYPLVVPDAGLPTPDEFHRRAVERLSALAATLKDVKTRIEVVTGVPHRVIAEEAKTRKIDLIAMTTHGRGGISRALMGSTAEKVVRIAPVPTLTVRPTQ
jgi:nucleotide-binding universal stress UspA family protein